MLSSLMPCYPKISPEAYMYVGGLDGKTHEQAVWIRELALLMLALSCS